MPVVCVINVKITHNDGSQKDKDENIIKDGGVKIALRRPSWILETRYNVYVFNYPFIDQ